MRVLVYYASPRVGWQTIFAHRHILSSHRRCEYSKVPMTSVCLHVVSKRLWSFPEQDTFMAIS